PKIGGWQVVFVVNPVKSTKKYKIERLAELNFDSTNIPKEMILWQK
ncbi:hypothetical protein SAMN04488507_10321, partial [Trichococcus flocculiformis]